MKNKGILFYSRITIVLSMFVVGVLVYSKLPETIPTHWGFDGMADAWGPKYKVFLTPVLSLAMLVLFPLLSKLDPKAENYKFFKKPWEVLQTVLVVFFGLIFALQVYFSLNVDVDGVMDNIMLMSVGVMFMVIGNLLGKIRHNYFIGFKTPWTLADPEVWQKSQRFAGWVMFAGGLVFFVNSFFQLLVVPMFIIVVASVVIVPTVYSYLVSRKNGG
jgi:uncharacterized membrane protein